MQMIRPKHLGIVVFLAALLLTLMPASADAWWNHDWSDRSRIAIDTSASGGGISDPIGSGDGVAVLVRLHSGNFKFDKAKSDGSDIRFVSSDGDVPLKFHLEKFDSLLGEAFAWVSVPNLKPGAQTTFYVYYGNAKVSSAGDAKDTYDSDTVLVYHFGEHGTPAHDYSRWSNNAQNAGTASDGSLIAGGLSLDGRTPITLPASQSLAWTAGQAFTVSVWVKQTSAAPNAVLLSRRDAAGALAIGLDNGMPYVEVSNAGAVQRSAPLPNALSAGWHHLAVVSTGQEISLYVDGSRRGGMTGAVPALSSAAVIGGDSAGGQAGVIGEIDELEISKVARPAGFIKLLAIGQGPDNGKLLGVGSTEENADWLSGYFGVILKSVTIDGWVVIGLLLIMAAISWIVMVEKATYLGRLDKANRHFITGFREIATDLTVLDREGAEAITGLTGKVTNADRDMQRNSSLYRIYHIGVEELRHRFQGGRSRVLSAQSIEAIRAALDGGLVRESQRLNRQMVLLTIAIAGGPFLGLLGTVIGVMITFASIAAVGDVNVNAIAPGISAALAATVAGLFVAIPALFGYNYLLSRIHNQTSDMQVFADEFTTKMAEFYSEQKVGA